MCVLMRKMFSDWAPWLLFVLLSITAVSAYRRDGVSRTDRDATAAGDVTTPSSTDSMPKEQLNCSEDCLEQSGVSDFNITRRCAMMLKCPPSIRRCVQQLCMSHNQECTAICNRICNLSNLGSDIASVCFQQCDPDSKKSFTDSTCEHVAIMNCRKSTVNNETFNCAKRCKKKGNCRKIIRGILDGNFTGDNIDAAVSVIRMFSRRRRTDRVPLPLDMRLESVEMLHSALRRRRRESIRMLGSTKRRREGFLRVFDEVLDDSEQDEWRTLQEASFSQNLLRSIETATELVTSAVKSSKQEKTTTFHFSGYNLVMDVECALPNSSLLHQLSPNTSGFMSVAAVRVGVHNSGQEEDECSAVVSTVLTRNLEEYITQNISNLSGIANTHLVTLQVSETPSVITNPVQLFFTPINVNMTDYLCVFWNFDKRRWSSENITTEFNGTHYICNSTHLTTFAVLVDVANNDENFSEHEEIALQVVSYIGCGISIFCLCLTILFLVLLRKSLDKGVLLYVHLNLAIALLASLVIFVAGIETAESVNWLCTVVAALLHYSFLSVFCWMLAEGIIVYYMLVHVFGTASEKWYYLLILGWGVPVPIVAIAVGITHEYYHDQNFCWLSVDKGVIWAFAGPVILIILVNTILLLVTVISIVRVRRKAPGKDNVRINTIVTAVKSIIILLPLLGMTWILGFLSLDSNSTVFAWLFTIFNSLQGCFIFILHVVRNDKVIAEIKKLWRCFFKTTAKKFSDEITKSTTNEETNVSNGDV